MIHRARTVAAGFADVGLTHAEELLRRMSPEGREQARREREAKARRQRRLMVRLVVAAVASLLIWALLAGMATAGVALAIASALMLLLTTLVFTRADPRAPGREALTQAALPCLAEEAVVWIAAQRRGLPPPALQLIDAMSRRLDELVPRLGRLDPRSPEAASIRKLVAVELPDLVEGWRAVPISMRRVSHADGRTPDDHLINGLQLIGSELAKAGEKLERSTFDEIAVQGRYLELKYSEDDRLP
ncbi:hypothetical protein [Sphingomonas mollis]|uniref:Uncharacterized protein n=1 Tax=Sphingomonas mollis TaxID=2795726 RepID=A0ABS0XLD6_9SPHN|nr:hypothetical protein [Sphingomonas sp. BT553]MBJ6120835.1 hypothetical protein [Sphingomonas sp. BT553]